MDAVEAQLIENDGVPLSNIDIVDDMMGKHKVNTNPLLQCNVEMGLVPCNDPQFVVMCSALILNES